MSNAAQTFLWDTYVAHTHIIRCTGTFIDARTKRRIQKCTKWVSSEHKIKETNSHRNDVIVESKRKIALGCDPKTEI